MGQGGGHPHTTRIVHRDGADAARLRAVQVRAIGISGSAARFVKRPLNRRPGFVVPTHRWDWAIGAMKVVMNIPIGFHLAKVGKHVGIRPAVIAPRRPHREILRQTPQQHLPIDRATTTDYFALGNVNLALFSGYGPGQRPVMRPVLPFGIAGMPVAQFVGEQCRIRIVGASLQQQHGSGWVFRESGCYHTTGRAAANHNHVVTHINTPYPDKSTGMRQRRHGTLAFHPSGIRAILSQRPARSAPLFPSRRTQFVIARSARSSRARRGTWQSRIRSNGGSPTCV